MGDKNIGDIEVAQCFNLAWSVICQKSNYRYPEDLDLMRQYARRIATQLLVDLRDLKRELSGPKGDLPAIFAAQKCIDETKKYNEERLKQNGDTFREHTITDSTRYPGF